MTYQINEHFDEQELDYSFQQQIATEKAFDEVCDLVEEEMKLRRKCAINTGTYDEEFDNHFLMSSASQEEMLDYLEFGIIPEHLKPKKYIKQKIDIFIPGPIETMIYDTAPFDFSKNEETEEEKQAKKEEEKQKLLEQYAKNNKHNWTLSKELRGIVSKPKKKESKSKKRKNRRRKFKINKDFPATM